MGKQWMQGTGGMLFLVTILGLGCGQNSVTQPPLPSVLRHLLAPSPSPSPSTNSLDRVYISGGSTIEGFSLPVTARSVPVVSFGHFGRGIAFDAAGRLLAMRGALASAGYVDVYGHPIMNASTPSFSLALPKVSCYPSYNCGWPTDVAADAANHIFVTASPREYVCGPYPRGGCGVVSIGALYIFNAPIRSTSTPTSIIRLRDPLQGVGVDRNGTVWTTKEVGDLIAWSPPYDVAHSFTVRAIARGGIAFDRSGNMYVAANDGIDVYRPPFSASMTKSFTISASFPEFLAFDSSGNLYVTTQTGNSLQLFNPPFSGATVPVLTFAMSCCPLGVTIGR